MENIVRERNYLYIKSSVSVGQPVVLGMMTKDGHVCEILTSNVSAILGDKYGRRTIITQNTAYKPMI